MTQPDLSELIERGLAIAEKATQGPWRYVSRDGFQGEPARVLCDDMVSGHKRDKRRPGEVCRVEDNDGRYDDQTDADVALIAFAGTHLKTILESHRALRAEVERLAGEYEGESRMGADRRFAAQLRNLLEEKS